MKGETSRGPAGFTRNKKKGKKYNYVESFRQYTHDLCETPKVGKGNAFRLIIRNCVDIENCAAGEATIKNK